MILLVSEREWIHLYLPWNNHQTNGFKRESLFRSIWVSQRQEGRGGDHTYTSLPFSPAHQHWGIYLQLFSWYVYLVFLTVAHVVISLLIDETYPSQLVSNWWIMIAFWQCKVTCHWFVADCLSELASAITQVLQTHQQTHLHGNQFYQYSKSSFLFHRLWIFPCVKLSCCSCIMRDKL